MTLLFAAKDAIRYHAVALREYLAYPHIPRFSSVFPCFFIVRVIFATWNRHERLRAQCAEARETVQRLLAEQR